MYLTRQLFLQFARFYWTVESLGNEVYEIMRSFFY